MTLKSNMTKIIMLSTQSRHYDHSMKQSQKKTLEELGWKQKTPVPNIMDNSAARILAKNTIKQKN